VKLQKKGKQIIQVLVNKKKFFKYQHYIKKRGKNIQVHNMLPKSAHCANAM